MVISGESGCGKSTLLNMIGGIETPDKGSIIVNGFDVAKRKKAEIFQRSCWIFISKFCPFGKQNSKRKSRNNKKKSGRTDISINEALEKLVYRK